MIAFRPSNVIEVMTEIAKQLYKASAPLLETFEEICRAIVDQRGPPFVLNDGDLLSDALKKFTKLLFYYIKCFKEWKRPDEIKLTSRLKLHSCILVGRVQFFYLRPKKGLIFWLVL